MIKDIPAKGTAPCCFKSWAERNKDSDGITTAWFQPELQFCECKTWVIRHNFVQLSARDIVLAELANTKKRLQKGWAGVVAVCACCEDKEDGQKTVD